MTKRAELIEGGLVAIALAGLTVLVRFIRHQGRSDSALKGRSLAQELQGRAKGLSVDRSYQQWSAEVRKSAAEGLPTLQRLGKKELLERSTALHKAI
jgi:hypothetical protein